MKRKTVAIYLELFLLVFVAVAKGASKPEFSVNMTGVGDKAGVTRLRCSVKDYKTQFSIFLKCPLSSNCGQNCQLDTCTDDCQIYDKIKCDEKGFDSKTGIYVIDYFINRNDPTLKGNWRCSYMGEDSSIVAITPDDPVNKNKLKIVSENVISSTSKAQSKVTVKEFNKLPNASKPILRKNRLPTNPSQSNQRGFAANLLTSQQFIYCIIALLIISLICNLIFCTKMMTNNCGTKKSVIHQEQMMLRRGLSTGAVYQPNPVDSERLVYDDMSHILPPISQQQQSNLLTKIQMGNGAYAANSSICPPTLTVGYPTLLTNTSNTLGGTGGVGMGGGGPIQDPYCLAVAAGNNNNNNYALSLEQQQRLASGSASSLLLHPPQYTNFVPPHQLQRSMYACINGNGNNSPYQLTKSQSSPPPPPPPLPMSPQQKQKTPQLQHRSISPSTTNSSSNNNNNSPTDLNNSNNSIHNSELNGNKIQRTQLMMQKADDLLRTANDLLNMPSNSNDASPDNSANSNNNNNDNDNGTINRSANTLSSYH